ncbi:MAG: MFS transporter [Planctomycetota bacterium]|jgi:ACS family D-galactonate transporter-like MFS transporter
MNGIPVDAEVSKPTRVRWRIVALLMAYIALCHFNRISMSVAGTEQIMPRYRIDETTMGFVYSSHLIVYTICMIPGGWFIDRFGARVALIVVGFGSAILVAFTGLTGLFFTTGGMLIAALLVVRGLFGAVTAPVHPGAALAVRVWTPVAARSTANGMVVGAACFGISATYFAFGIMSDYLGWIGAFVTAGVATSLLALVWTSYSASSPGQHRGVNQAEREVIEKGSVSFAALPKEKASWSAAVKIGLFALTFSYATVSYVEYLFFYWIQYYFETVLDLGKTTGRLYGTLLTLAMGVGIVVGGWLCDRSIGRFGRRVGIAIVPVLGMAACSLGLGLGVLFEEPIVSVLCFMIAMAAIGATEAPFWTSAIEIGGRQAGKAAAIMNTGGNGGGLLAPIITPLFSHYFGWQAGLALAAPICLLGALPWFWIDVAAQSSDASGEDHP